MIVIVYIILIINLLLFYCQFTNKHRPIPPSKNNLILTIDYWPLTYNYKLNKIDNRPPTTDKCPKYDDYLIKLLTFMNINHKKNGYKYFSKVQKIFYNDYGLLTNNYIFLNFDHRPPSIDTCHTAIKRELNFYYWLLSTYF